MCGVQPWHWHIVLGVWWCLLASNHSLKGAPMRILWSFSLDWLNLWISFQRLARPLLPPDAHSLASPSSLTLRRLRLRRGGGWKVPPSSNHPTTGSCVSISDLGIVRSEQQSRWKVPSPSPTLQHYHTCIGDSVVDRSVPVSGVVLVRPRRWRCGRLHLPCLALRLLLFLLSQIGRQELCS